MSTKSYKQNTRLPDMVKVMTGDDHVHLKWLCDYLLWMQDRVKTLEDQVMALMEDEGEIP